MVDFWAAAHFVPGASFSNNSAQLLLICDSYDFTLHLLFIYFAERHPRRTFWRSLSSLHVSIVALRQFLYWRTCVWSDVTWCHQLSSYLQALGINNDIFRQTNNHADRFFFLTFRIFENNDASPVTTLVFSERKGEGLQKPDYQIFRCNGAVSATGNLSIVQLLVCMEVIIIKMCY